MKVAVFSTKPYDREYLKEANQIYRYKLDLFEPHLSVKTCKLAFGYEVVCAFVNDCLDAAVLEELSRNGTRLIVLRSAGFNHVDIKAAEKLDITVARVPAYSPHGVAEHAVALILALNRKIYRAYNRVREGNFSLDGLIGFELCGQTAGVLGTGKIGSVFIKIMQGFGVNVIAYDPVQNPDIAVEYVALDELFSRSDIISLHLPLTPATKHLINKQTIQSMKKGVMLINTSRGGLIDTPALISGLKSGAIGYVGLDVYEEESDIFFEDLSSQIIQDDIFARLLTFPNVVVTGHQAFFTRNALKAIAETTLRNIRGFQDRNIPKSNLVTSQLIGGK
ncbi:MAG: 2-hydroxyacid dehydrogenase [Candidatus Omnitrophota bacterium]|nr:2-hydroxyacid dehydrogenase [Candidatus Omnitrophota bacterium]